MNPWPVFVGMALVTYLTRFAMMPFLSRELPGPLLRWLQLVPVAILTALIAPAVLVAGQRLVVGPRLPAAVVGAIVAWRTRSVLLTIIAGMLCYWAMVLLL
ncbi:MAG: AzlD domain-containing protein [Chloroflexi bacterium]|nr:AzlD domain-containing protein [Chloroflexota bacterium]